MAELITGGPQEILRGGSGCAGHFVSSCYMMSIPCPARCLIVQSAFYGDGNSLGNRTPLGAQEVTSDTEPGSYVTLHITNGV